MKWPSNRRFKRGEEGKPSRERGDARIHQNADVRDRHHDDEANKHSRPNWPGARPTPLSGGDVKTDEYPGPTNTPKPTATTKPTATGTPDPSVIDRQVFDDWFNSTACAPGTTDDPQPVWCSHLAGVSFLQGTRSRHERRSRPRIVKT